MKAKLALLICGVLLVGMVIASISCGKNPISSVITGTKIVGKSGGNFTLGVGKM